MSSEPEQAIQNSIVRLARLYQCRPHLSSTNDDIISVTPTFVVVKRKSTVGKIAKPEAVPSARVSTFAADKSSN